MKHTKRIISVLLAALIIIGSLPFFAFATEENTSKEEVVYINLNGDGSVKEINVVNIFDLDEAGQIIDYGKYESLRNMTTTDKISYTGEIVTINAKAGKLYYEGKLESQVMPWNIEVHYYIDGNEYSAEDVAGKSGALKITMKITENPECAGDFFKAYALQASFTLDTKTCSDIRADGATIANVGSDKQLTYTILPDKGAEIDITADVHNFEMSPIAINGIKLNLSIEIGDEEIQNKIDEIIGAVNEIDEGAGELKDGAEEIYSGTKKLDEKVGELYTGVGKLNDGADELSSGIYEISDKNDELLDGAYSAFEGICTASEAVLNAELTKNGLDTVTLTPENYTKVLNKLLKTMDSDSVYTMAYNEAYSRVEKQVNAKADDIYKGYIEENEDDVYATYVQSQSETLYAQVAAQAVLEQLMGNGFNEEQATAYLQTEEGQSLIAQALATMTKEQKQQIITTATEKLTDEQKSQIKSGAVAALTDEQKEEIKNGYIEQTMKSKEVTEQITAAVSAANSAVASVTELKGQLDNYSLFYGGLKEYTSAVSEAASGAEEFKKNMSELYTNVGVLQTSVGELNEGVKLLFEGTTELKNGTGEFVKETEGIDSEVSDEIDSMISEATGSEVEITSFVSDKNANVESVQFVIQTEKIEITEADVTEEDVAEKLNFWQKLLKLFGID